MPLRSTPKMLSRTIVSATHSRAFRARKRGIDHLKKALELDPMHGKAGAVLAEIEVELSGPD